MDESRLETTYQNFRSAVATGNDQLQKALLPVLTRDRDVAIGRASRDLLSAPSDLDRDIAQRTLNSLRK